jgi:hypothetical protein
MNGASNRDKLALESRVNYGKVYTVEHNVKVCFIGEIHADYRARFFTDFKIVFDSEDDRLSRPRDSFVRAQATGN